MAGLVAGKKCRDPALYSPVLKTMFVGASVGLGAVVATSAVQAQLSPELLYALLVALMVLCGNTTLGFIGVVSLHDSAGIWVAFFSRRQRYRCQQALS